MARESGREGWLILAGFSPGVETPGWEERNHRPQAGTRRGLKVLVMPQSATLIYVHFIWATWDRAPVILPAWENRVYGCLRNKCMEMNCESLAIGGIENHVHVLAKMYADIAVSQLAKAMKGASSYLINREITPHQEFKWQGGYGALSVSRTHVVKIQNYINNQKEHHAGNKLWSSLETMNFD